MSSILHSSSNPDEVHPDQVSEPGHIHDAMPRSQKTTVLVGLLVWIGCAVYLLSFVERGWIPHDEGLLAHSAERVLNGELPHQDFDDCYTGGLAFLHSVSFRLFGTNLSALRWTLFGGTMLFVPLLYLLALRCCTPVVAGLVTLVCVAWSVPNYFASMPSWYILFFTIAAVYSLTRFVKSESWIPLCISGLCCGLAILCKINGLFAVATGLLFLLYHDQTRSQRLDTQAQSNVVRVAATAIAFGWSALVFLLLRRHLEARLLINLLLPSLTISAFLTWNEWVNGRGRLSQRVVSLTKDVSIFVTGVCLPLGCYLIPYVASGSVSDVVHGVFVLPQQRLDSATESFPPLFTFVATIPMALFLFGGWARGEADPGKDRRVTIAVFAFIGTALFFSSSWAVHSAILLSVRVLPPLAVLAVALFVVRRSQHLTVEQRETLVLLMLGTTALSLIQFPFAANIYFCYFAPLLILMIVYFRSMVPSAVSMRDSGVLVFFLLFAVLSLNQCYVAGGRFPDDEALLIRMSRASLTSRPVFARAYPEIVEIVQRYSKPGDAIYAAPDCPEIYFLADRQNPTRTMYDFFDSTENRTDKLIELLRREDLNVVVVYAAPAFSSKMDRRLQLEVKKRFPHRQEVGPFVVAVRNQQIDATSETQPDSVRPAKPDIAGNPDAANGASS
jgi:hypothetical protein